jgi:putative phage-type endonuclease
MNKDWKDCGDYWEYLAPQGSEKWKNARMGRVNSSDSGAIVGESSFKTPEQTGKIIAGLDKVEDNAAMQHGHKYEIDARKWYSQKYNVQVLERGLCVCKYDITIGASVDGEVLNSDKIIEIKCPLKMYKPIQNYIDNLNRGWKPEKNYVGHIFKLHYCQMQQAMFVLNKKYCDYIVYCTSTLQIFNQRINFDPEFWRSHYLKIKENYNLHVVPYILRTDYPISPYSISTSL